MNPRTPLLILSLALSAAAFASPLSFGLGLGPLIGLDRALRGGALSLELGIEPAAFLGRPGSEASRGLGLGARAELSYDSSLESWQAAYALFLALGPDLRLEAGGGLPLSPASMAEPSSGARFSLSPLPFPSRFAFEATIAEIGPPPGGEEVRSPRLLVLARLGWAAYEAAAEGAVVSPEISGSAGFAAGLLAGLLLELEWGR